MGDLLEFNKKNKLEDKRNARYQCLINEISSKILNDEILDSIDKRLIISRIKRKIFCDLYSSGELGNIGSQYINEYLAMQKIAQGEDPDRFYF